MTESASKHHAVARDPEPGTAVVAQNSSSVVASQTQARLTAEMEDEAAKLEHGYGPGPVSERIRGWVELVQSLSLPQAGGALTYVNVWLLHQRCDGEKGLRGVHATQELAEAEMRSIMADHPDLKREDFWLSVERIRGFSSPALPEAGGEPLKALNGWRELGVEMERILLFMTPEQRADLLPDWFHPRLKEMLTSSPAGAEGQEIASTEQDMASRVDGQSCPDRPSASTGSTAPRD